MRLFSRLFIYFFTTFLALVVVIAFFQYNREKEFRTEQLDQLLSTYNHTVNRFVEINGFDNASLDEFIKVLPDSSVRITVIKFDGEVLYDSYVKDESKLENHINRPEVKDANQGKGVSIRKSGSTGIEFYYLAHKFQHYYIRSALPYNLSLAATLSANLYFMYIIFFVLVVASLILYFISKNITRSIDRLQLFLQKAENEQVEEGTIVFPKDQLGQISANIVKTYKNLWRTQWQVRREREKLIQHLQISQEGLGIFSTEKKEILVNAHFTLYAQIVSDKELTEVDEIFYLPEFAELNQFIDESLQIKGIHRKRMQLEKGGRIFLIQAIVFKDATFEISINDITVQEQENRLKRQLTQNISHELKTPVSSIMGYMESIINNPGIDEGRKSFFIERSFQQAQRLSALLQDISMLNKIDESKNIFEKEPVDLVHTVKDVLEDVHLQLEERGCTVDNHLSGSLQLHGNRSLLYSIFRNLTDNALAYAGQDITLRIECYREDAGNYYFSFSDNGVGVNEEHLPRLFERFYRVDKGRSRKAGGTGLGLAIVKNAVIFHGGSISAKNIPTGGLNFIFSLKK